MPGKPRALAKINLGGNMAKIVPEGETYTVIAAEGMETMIMMAEILGVVLSSADQGVELPNPYCNLSLNDALAVKIGLEARALVLLEDDPSQVLSLFSR